MIVHMTECGGAMFLPLNTPEQMMNQHMANEISSHQFTCPSMHFEFHNL
jgi:hypothetical protein